MSQSLGGLTLNPEGTISGSVEKQASDLGLGPENAPRVTGVKVRKGLGAKYDEAVASGQYEPGFFARVAVAVVRVMFPDSQPTTIITYSDGTTEILLGGGPSSGALGGQAAAITGFAAAASKGKLIGELVESVVDTAFQEATELSVGPSTVKSGLVPRSPAARVVRAVPRTNQQLVEDIAARAAKNIDEPRPTAGTDIGSSASDPHDHSRASDARPSSAKPLADDRSGSQPTQVQTNRAAGDAVRDRIAAREAPALTEQGFATVGGVRRVDVLKVGDELVGIESKVGRTSLDTRVRQELARDWWLRRQRQLDRIAWEFTPSATTGIGGPTAPLRQKLHKLGFHVRINP
jgi:hypothetical protein